MSKKDINKSEFSEETKLKLDLFRECYREWFPVFVHNSYIKHIYVYDMFAGSGKDTVGNPGSPIILFQESRGDKKQHCKALLKNNAPKVSFAFNEYEPLKKEELEANVSKEFELCKSECSESRCPFEGSFYYGQNDFSTLINSSENCNINNDFEQGSLFYSPTNTIKKVAVQEELEYKILHSEISDNETGLKYALKKGCEPKLFVETVKKLQNQNKIEIDGEFNAQSTNIHKVEKYKIVVK